MVLPDGTVAFKCSSDIHRWPWLALHPFDPIVVQTIHYWVSVETGVARGSLDPTKWSALTQMEWLCCRPDAGHASHGIAEEGSSENGPHVVLSFFDDEGSPVYRMKGIGVVFQNRDFEGWRQKAKQKIAALPAATGFEYAPAQAAGVATQSQSFLSSLDDGERPSALGLITEENGFPPAHPYLSGSGDHVNATHLAEVGRQFASLLRGGKSLKVSGGEMRFLRYVELGYPFVVTQELRDGTEYSLSMTVHQADRPCATISLGVEPGH